MNDEKKDLKIGLVTFAGLVHSHIHALEQDLARAKKAEKPWNSEHAAFALCITMKGITNLAAQFCEEYGVPLSVLKKADGELDKLTEKTTGKLIIPKPPTPPTPPTKDNPNAAALFRLLNSVMSSGAKLTGGEDGGES